MATKLASKNAGRKLLISAGVPMIGFLIGGTYVLSTFMQTHYELKDKNNNSKSTRKFDLEEEHNKLIKSLDIDNYSLSRIPRAEDLEKAAAERELKRLKKKEKPKPAVAVVGK